MSKLFTQITVFVFGAVVFVSCSKQEGCTDPEATNYDAEAEKEDGSCEYGSDLNIPDTYNFENVSYQGQTDRLNMLEEMTALMKEGNEGNSVSAQKLKEMYANTGSHFTFSSEKQLKSKTFSSVVDSFETWMERLEAASNSGQSGSNGQAGVVSSNSGDKAYLFDAKGFEYTQLIEKGLMGACFYYQGTGVYMSDDKIGPTVDNEKVVEGEGTDMEHHWDEAFGYFGVPEDFPQNSNDVRFHGKYCNGRNDLLNTNQRIMDAFIAGRAAISQGDMDRKNTERQNVRAVWEEVIAATAVHYINSGKTNYADDALRNHALSEAYAFIWSLKFNPERKIDNAKVDELLVLLGDNLYEVEIDNLNTIRDELSAIYAFEDVKSNL